jgi:hypothetical protein
MKGEQCMERSFRCSNIDDEQYNEVVRSRIEGGSQPPLSSKDITRCCMAWKWTIVALVSVMGLHGLIAGLIHAGESQTSGPGPIERIEETAKKFGKSIEEGVKSTMKKIEEEHIPEKVEQKIKKTMDETVEGLERTGKEIEKKFSQ